MRPVSRSFVSSIFIQSSGGSGGRNLSENSGQADDDYSVRALLRAKEEQKQIALVADDQYRLFPYELDPKWMYVVLGFYQIVDAWGMFCYSSYARRVAHIDP